MTTDLAGRVKHFSNLLRPREGVVVAGDAGHDGPLVWHGGAAEVYKQVSQHTGQLLEQREGETQRKLES